MLLFKISVMHCNQLNFFASGGVLHLDSVFFTHMRHKKPSPKTESHYFSKKTPKTHTHTHTQKQTKKTPQNPQKKPKQTPPKKPKNTQTKKHPKQKKPQTNRRLQRGKQVCLTCFLFPQFSKLFFVSLVDENL